MIEKQLLETYNKSRDTTDKSIICHAPFVSLNFEQNGNVTACCYNRTYILGSYPQHSLQEIWKGEKADKLREYIQENDLSHGCHLCLDQLESGNYSGMRARGYDRYAHKKLFFLKQKVKMPRVLEFELSNTCNLECIMCNGEFSSSIRKNREMQPEKTNPYDAQFVEQLTDFFPKLKVAKFLGGEPFLIDLYYEIWDKMIEINPKILIEITTNGTILNEKVKRTLEILRSNIIISIDSINKTTYEQIRKNSNYERVMENLEYFIDYAKRKKTALFFSVCPIRKNWQEIPRLVEYCNEKGISIFFNTVLNPPGLSLTSMRKRDIDKVVAQYENVELPSDNEVQRKNLETFNSLVNQVKEWAQRAHKFEAEPIEKHEDNLAEAVDLYKELIAGKEELPTLLKSMMHIHMVAQQTLPNIEESYHYYPYFEKEMELYTETLNELLNHYPHITDLKYYYEALISFYKAITPEEDEDRDEMIRKLDKVLEIIPLIKNPEKMYHEVISKSPHKMLKHIAEIPEIRLTPFLLNNFK